MVLELQLHERLQKYAPQNASGIVNIDISEGTSIQELIELMGICTEEVRMITVNGKSVRIQQSLADGDHVGLFPKEEKLNQRFL